MGEDELYFCWDDSKAASNLAKHRISFEMATYAFDDPDRLEDQDWFAEGEYRNIVIGVVETLLLTVVYTEPEDGLIRLISARLATPAERRAYEQHLLHP